MWRKKGTANNPKHTASSVKHDGGGVMAWAWMAVSGTGPLNWWLDTDDLIYDGSSRMNLEGYKTILPNNIQENGTRLIEEVLHIASEQWPKTPCQFSQGIYKGKEMESLRKSISRFKSDRTWISPAEEESKGRNSPKQATIGIGCINGWEKYFEGWDQESGV